MLFLLGKQGFEPREQSAAGREKKWLFHTFTREGSTLQGLHSLCGKSCEFQEPGGDQAALGAPEKPQTCGIPGKELGKGFEAS